MILQFLLSANIKTSKNTFQAKEITELDLKAVFRLVDVDKSGNISRTVRNS